MSTPSPARRAAQTIVPIVAALLFLSVVAEMVTRFVNRSGDVYDVEMYRYSRLLKEDAPPEAQAMHHWHRPNAEAVLQGVLIRTNALRMRDRPRSESPEPGTRRLLVLGDSITLGWGVSQEATYSAVLEARLAQDNEGPRYEVLNAGVGNYTLARMVGYYDFALRRLNPETVILSFYLTNASREQESSLGRLLDTPLQFPVFLWSRGLRAYSRLSPTAGFREYYLDLYRDGGDEYEEFKRRLADFVTRLRAEGRNVLLVNVPDVRYASERPYPFASISERVLAIGRQAGAETLDLTDSVSGLPPRLAVNSAEDRHPAGVVHERFAEAILGALRRAGFAPPLTQSPEN
jgi:lysophospholipase L1-like esterase